MLASTEDVSNPRRWPALGVGLVVGAALGWLAFFVLPARLVEAPRTSVEPSSKPTAAARISAAGLALGSPAPAFELVTPSGEAIALEQLRGQVVLINFWATWCAPCRTEMPLLQSAANQHAEAGLLVLGVNFDETAEQVQTYAEELSLEFPLLLDPGGQVQELYGVRGYPTTAVIDRQGQLAAYHIGVLIPQQLDSYLQQAGLFE